MAGVLSPQSGQDMVFVGTTNGGPPASGSFVPGNWCHDNVTVYLCVQGGTPGTWADVGTDVAARYVSGAWKVPAGPHPWIWLVPDGGPYPVTADGLAAADVIVDSLLTNPHGNAARWETVANRTVTSTMATGTGYVCFGIPERSITVTKLWVNAGATVTAVLTLCQLGLFTVDGSSNLTLVAQTAHDTGLIVANTDKSSALATAGGYPASYPLLRGTTYAMMFLPVFGSGSLITRSDIGSVTALPIVGATVAGLAAMPTSVAVGSLTRLNQGMWMAAEA